MLQLCRTRQLSSEGLSIIHIHERDVRELLGGERSVKQLQGFFSSSPFLLDMSDRMSYLSFPTPMQPIQTHLVEIHEINPQHLERPNRCFKAASIFTL